MDLLQRARLVFLAGNTPNDMANDAVPATAIQLHEVDTLHLLEHCTCLLLQEADLAHEGGIRRAFLFVDGLQDALDPESPIPCVLHGGSVKRAGVEEGNGLCVGPDDLHPISVVSGVLAPRWWIGSHPLMLSGLR